jgi:hypothetical protein
MSDPELQATAKALLSQVGIAEVPKLQRITGGSNNRVFRLDAGGCSFCLKVYFRHAADSRDRLRTEFDFASFAWSKGLRGLPQPLAFDAALGAGLFEFVAGRKLAPAEVDAPAVSELIAFHRALNRHRDHPDAQALPPASDSCFSVADNIACIDRRLGRLTAIHADSALERDALQIVRERLAPACSRAKSALIRGAERQDQTVSLAQPERWLSVSDIGFHNALRANTGKIRLLDFEYAGWDDPAKTIADLFGQPEVPVPMAFFEPSLSAVAGDFAAPERMRARARLLLPLHRLKWCCIVLNEFLPVGGDRRAFAADGEERERRRVTQLQKARGILASLSEVSASP